MIEDGIWLEEGDHRDNAFKGCIFLHPSCYSFAPWLPEGEQLSSTMCLSFCLRCPWILYCIFSTKPFCLSMGATDIRTEVD